MKRINLDLGLGQNLFFTSDLHFGHRNMITFKDRPFKDIKDMEEGLIKNWNEVVGPDDYIFDLGDFMWFNSRTDTRRVASKLNGHKYMLFGNHDQEDQYSKCEDLDLTVCGDVVHLHVTVLGVHFGYFILSHYPLVTWARPGEPNQYHLFGHIHSVPGGLLEEYGEPLIFNHPGLCMDVGTDRHNMRPVSYREIINEIYEYPYWDRHTINKPE